MFFRVGGEAAFASVVSRVGDLYIIVVFTLKKTSRVSDSWCLTPRAFRNQGIVDNFICGAVHRR